MRNPTADLEIVRQLMTDETPIPLNLALASGAIIVAGILLMEKHPDLTPAFKRLSLTIRETIRQAMRGVDPAFADMLKDGYEDALDERAVSYLSKTGALLVTLPVRDVWLTLSIMQAVTRHPDLTPFMLTQIENIGRQIQAYLAGIHPHADDLMDAGWDPDQDVG